MIVLIRILQIDIVNGASYNSPRKLHSTVATLHAKLARTSLSFNTSSPDNDDQRLL